MTVQDVLSQIEYKDGKIKSLSTGRVYEVDDFVNQIADKLKWNKQQREKLRGHFQSYLKPQTDESVYTEQLIEKYKLTFTDGVYMLNGRPITDDDLYRFMWKQERLLPDNLRKVLSNVEMISEPISLRDRMYREMENRFSPKSMYRSKYLQSLDELYPDIPFRNIMCNILTPNTKPMFHVFYDNGVGGTGKSTFLEVLTLLVGENNVSNVLLDQFGNRFVFANMLGKYLNIGDDNGKNDELQNVGTLKSIVTGGRVTIDRKFMPPIECRIFAKQLFATNIMPYIDFTDGGIMRRLNIVPMNKVIPKDMKLCKLDESELCAIFNEIIRAGDLKENSNELAITQSPLYRFYTTQKDKSYSNYKNYCIDNGFRTMNIINFETKLKFIREYIKRGEESIEKLKEADDTDMPF